MGPSLDHPRHLTRRAGLARARIMGARYPYYLLADSREGQIKEAEVTRSAPSSQPTRGNIRHGFVYERVPHITLKSIANNAEIDVIWDKWQRSWNRCANSSTRRLGRRWQEWEIPREQADAKWPQMAGRQRNSCRLVAGRIARQKEIDASIAAKADSNTSTTSPTRTRRRSASPARSPSKACHPTACWA
jgi:adenine-specific DNA-methyltransferase